MPNLLQITHARLQDLMALIESQDGEITDEQEQMLQTLLREEKEAIPEAAKSVYETETEAELRRETRRKWNELAGEQIHRLENRAAKLRKLIVQAMSASGETTMRTDDRAVDVTLCKPRTSGRLEIDLEEAKAEGYTFKAVAASNIPAEFFEERTVFALDKDALREWLKENKSNDARLVFEPSIRIKIAG